MNINLNPGTYIVTIEYNGLMRSNTMEILIYLLQKAVTIISMIMTEQLLKLVKEG